jgi:hypothetical protein
MSSKISSVDTKGMSTTDRKKHFSLSAKMCSGKAQNEKEAEKLVKKDHPEWFL